MNITTIKTNEEAQTRLASKLAELLATQADLKTSLGDFTPDETAEAEKCLSNLSAMTPRHWSLVQLENLAFQIKGIQTTQQADLIFPDGQYLLLPVGEQLISPAGFHPDERVFIKPSAGAIVSKLPKSSNLACCDFTK